MDNHHILDKHLLSHTNCYLGIVGIIGAVIVMVIAEGIEKVRGMVGK